MDHGTLTRSFLTSGTDYDQYRDWHGIAHPNTAGRQVLVLVQTTTVHLYGSM